MNFPQSIKIFFFGDSICFGQGVAIHKGWVTKISAGLSEVYGGRDPEVIVINASINGNTTRLALERMPYDIQSQGADLLVVQFGMNDCNYWETDRGNPRVSPAAFGANLAEIMDRAFTFGVYKLLINTNHPTARDAELMPYAGVTYQQSNEQYNRIIRDVVARAPSERVVFIDIEKTFQDHINNDRQALLKLLQPDLLHLSDAGHDLYFNSIYPIVLDTIKAMIERK